MAVRRYYFTSAQAGLGTIPREAGGCTICNFPEPKFCGEIGDEAWGCIDSFCDDIIGYKILQKSGMVYAGEVRTYWCARELINCADKSEWPKASPVRAYQGTKQPHNSSHITRDLIIHERWFDSKEEADRWIQE